jgi:hypothetical protein
LIEAAMSDVNPNLDRITIRQMVEDGFRSQLLFHQNYLDTHPHSSPQESQEAAHQFLQRWLDRTEATAALMPAAQGAAFKEMVGEEYGFLAQELERNPQALCQRFGINWGRSAPLPVYHRQGLGELAVRTAVRATVWEMIWSLFRR